METLQYKIIKTDTQYNRYCGILEKLLENRKKTKAMQDEIELLTLLIEKYDEARNTFDNADPIQLLRSLMNEHNLKAKDLVAILNTSKGYVSEILNYKKGLSKEVIRALATYFKVSQEAFNREYKLSVSENARLKNASVMNTRKHFVRA